MTDAELLAQAFDALPDAVTIFDEEFRIVYLNEVASRLLHSSGREPARLTGQLLMDAIPETRSSEWERALHEAARPGGQTHFERFAPALRRWTETRVVPKGRFFVSITRDIHQRHEQELATSLLADAGRALAESLEFRSTLQAVANLVTPALADWCSVDLLTANGKIETLAVAHVNDAKVTWAWDFKRRYPTDPAEVAGVANVIRTGKSELYPDISDDMLAQSAPDKDYLRTMRELQIPLRTDCPDDGARKDARGTHARRRRIWAPVLGARSSPGGRDCPSQRSRGEERRALSCSGVGAIAPSPSFSPA